MEQNEHEKAVKYSDQKPIIVLGGGISGLSTAWFLHKAGIPFRLFEKSSRTGGKIESEEHEGTILDFGPNSIRDLTGQIIKLVEELSLAENLIEISEAFKTRYIVRGGKLHGLSPSIKSMLFSKTLSTQGKLRVLKEPFISSKEVENESVGSFLERRIGKEAVEYLVDPVFSGIYGGDIHQMSKNLVLDKLAGYEQEFGSLFWGAVRSKREKKSIKPQVISFRQGIQQLTEEITRRLSDSIIHEEVISVKPAEEAYVISTHEEVFEASQVISCIPAYQLSRILKGFEPELSSALNDVDYVPMLSTQVIFEKEKIKTPNGFGFLIPRKEKYRLLGAINKSQLFPTLTSPERQHFTLMTGGAHDRKILTDSVEEIERQVISEFSSLMNITEQPLFVKSKLWTKAIPQFELGFSAIKQKIEEAEKQYPGFYIGGNFRWGISVPDCIEGGRKWVNDLMNRY